MEISILAKSGMNYSMYFVLIMNSHCPNIIADLHWPPERIIDCIVLLIVYRALNGMAHFNITKL